MGRGSTNVHGVGHAHCDGCRPRWTSGQNHRETPPWCEGFACKRAASVCGGCAACPHPLGRRHDQGDDPPRAVAYEVHGSRLRCASCCTSEGRGEGNHSLTADGSSGRCCRCYWDGTWCEVGPLCECRATHHVTTNRAAANELDASWARPLARSPSCHCRRWRLWHEAQLQRVQAKGSDEYASCSRWGGASLQEVLKVYPRPTLEHKCGQQDPQYCEAPPRTGVETAQCLEARTVLCRGHSGHRSLVQAVWQAVLPGVPAQLRSIAPGAPNSEGWVYLPACQREGCVARLHLPRGTTHDLTPTQMAYSGRWQSTSAR